MVAVSYNTTRKKIKYLRRFYLASFLIVGRNSGIDVVWVQWSLIGSRRKEVREKKVTSMQKNYAHFECFL